MDSTHRPTDEPQYRECPECGELVDWDTVIWLNGKCTCPDCYERIRLKIAVRTS